jgi:hypothetical protein
MASNVFTIYFLSKYIKKDYSIIIKKIKESGGLKNLEIDDEDSFQKLKECGFAEALYTLKKMNGATTICDFDHETMTILNNLVTNNDCPKESVKLFETIVDCISCIHFEKNKDMTRFGDSITELILWNAYIISEMQVKKIRLLYEIMSLPEKTCTMDYEFMVPSRITGFIYNFEEDLIFVNC